MSCIFCNIELYYPGVSRNPATVPNFAVVLDFIPVAFCCGICLEIALELTQIVRDCHFWDLFSSILAAFTLPMPPWDFLGLP